jgi:hypothetical protein
MATQEQMIGNSILDELKFELIPAQDADGNLIFGGPQTFKATSGTIEFVRSLVDEGKRLVLEDQGQILFEDDLEDGPPSSPK